MRANTCCSIAAAEGLFGRLGSLTKRLRLAPSSRGRPASGRRSKFIPARFCAAELLQKKVRVKRNSARGDFIGPHFGSRTFPQSRSSRLCAHALDVVAISDKDSVFEDQRVRLAPLKLDSQ